MRDDSLRWYTSTEVANVRPGDAANGEEHRMDADSALAQVRSHHQPSEWNVWPLRRNYVISSAIKWGLLGLVGLAMLIPVTIVTVPSDFVGKGSAQQSLAAAVLVLLAALAFGGIGIALHDLWRLARADDYWLVITPETFIKAEPGRVIETPLEYVADLTLKGVRLPSEGGTETNAPMPQFLMSGRLMNYATTLAAPTASRQRARGNASLAYRDSRDNKVVTVCTDEAFDHMAAIYQILRDRSAAREDKVWRASLQSHHS